MIWHVARICILGAVLMGNGFPVFGSQSAVEQPGAAIPAERASSSDIESFHSRTRTAIKEVLAGNEFANMNADPYIFWRKFLRSIGDFFSRWHVPPWVVWTIVTWLLLTLVAILAHLIYTLWKITGAGPGSSPTNDSAFNHPQELLGIRDLDFDAIYARTGHLLTAGDWLGAIKYLYVAAILWLDRKGLIAFRSSKTNLDYIRELKARTRVQDMFRQLTFCFEPIVYGGQTATKSTANDMAGTVRRIIHEPTSAITS